MRIPVRMPVLSATVPITDGVTIEPIPDKVTKMPMASGQRPKTSPAFATVVPYMPERESPSPIVPASIRGRLFVNRTMQRKARIPADRIRMMTAGAKRPPIALQPKQRGFFYL